jgi:putative restriction endonuclease
MDTEIFEGDMLLWLERMGSLNIDRAKGPAPHKPILILIILDYFEEGLLSDGWLNKDGQLAFRFKSYWSMGARRRSSRPDVRLPFYHLKSDKIIVPYDDHGSVANYRDVATSALIHPGFIQCLSNAGFRDACRKTILSEYFSGEEQSDLANFLKLDLPLSCGAADGLNKLESARKRNARFAFQVLPAYDFQCALSGYQMITTDGITALDAAHIKRFTSGGPCVVNNGMALTKTAHWLFDRGLWSVDSNYRVLVKESEFEERGDVGLLLGPRSGEQLYLPKKDNCLPDLEYLAWHRDYHRFSA